MSDTFQLPNRGSYNPNLPPPPEFRAMYMKYTDPLHINFKLMINVQTETGFFGGTWMLLEHPTQESIFSDIAKKCPNSAVGYLFRIQDYTRLALWRDMMLDFVDLVKNWDFLQESVEGLEDIITAPEHAAWVDATITINFRETVISRVQRVLERYRHIWWDTERCVQVLPRNLQAMDLSILVYNSGYWATTYDSDNEEGKLFPTIHKIQTLDPTHIQDDYPFVYHLFRFPSAYYHYNTGSTYFSEVNNNVGNSEVHTKLTFEFYGVQYTSSYKSSIDLTTSIAHILETAAAIQDSVALRDYGSKIMSTNNKGLGAYFDSWEKAINDSIKGVTKALVDNPLKLADNIWNKATTWFNDTLNKPLTWFQQQSTVMTNKLDQYMTSLLTGNKAYTWLMSNFGDTAANTMITTHQGGGVSLGRQRSIPSSPQTGGIQGPQQSTIQPQTQTGGIRYEEHITSRHGF